MFSKFYKPKKPELKIGRDFVVNSGYALYLLVVWSYPASNQAVGGREFLEHIYEDTVAEFLLQMVGRIESCRSRPYDSNFYFSKTHGVRLPTIN